MRLLPYLAFWEQPQTDSLRHIGSRRELAKGSAHKAVFAAVTEVNRKADCKPDDESEPGVQRQARHQKQ